MALYSFALAIAVGARPHAHTHTPLSEAAFVCFSVYLRNVDEKKIPFSVMSVVHISSIQLMFFVDKMQRVSYCCMNSYIVPASIPSSYSSESSSCLSLK